MMNPYITSGSSNGPKLENREPSIDLSKKIVYSLDRVMPSETRKL